MREQEAFTQEGLWEFRVLGEKWVKVKRKRGQFCNILQNIQLFIYSGIWRLADDPRNGNQKGNEKIKEGKSNMGMGQ